VAAWLYLYLCNFALIFDSAEPDSEPGGRSRHQSFLIYFDDPLYGNFGGQQEQVRCLFGIV
jgi:hypothetical protein